MAAEGSASRGAGIPWLSGCVPAGDQVFTAEALGPAVELVGGTFEVKRGAVTGRISAALQAPRPGRVLPVVGELELQGRLAEAVIRVVAFGTAWVPGDGGGAGRGCSDS